MARPTESPAVIPTAAAFRDACDKARAEGRRVALVPTMGALHRGHLALMEEARRRVGADGLVAVSIFVNPTQFGPNEDFSRYPRELDADVARCASVGVDAVFAPPPSEMYPAGDQTRVRVPELAGPMCGVSRPVHFEGVATVVTKLLALTGPCVAVFGRKDYQQFRVISRLTTDLFLPAEIVGLPTIREPDGLALSSRNRYLATADRQRAVAIPTALRALRGPATPRASATRPPCSTRSHGASRRRSTASTTSSSATPTTSRRPPRRSPRGNARCSRWP